MRPGAKQFFERRGGGGWQNPYVTDGLVAMWDGEWNAGPGVHDQTASEWVNVIGGGYGNIKVGRPDGNCWDLSGVMHEQQGTFTTPRTIEIIVSGFDNNVKTYHIASFGDGYGDVSGSMVLLYMRIYNNYAGLYYNGNRTGMGAVFGMPPRITYVWEDDTHLTQIRGNVTNQHLSISGLSASNVYNAFSLNRRAESGIMAKYHAIRFYSSSLTSSEIAANYAVDKERFNLP